jgi:2-polyprenyl-3-methyl-5-hydroxy-6-metoxy-1,4-benzoquinol methylase
MGFFACGLGTAPDMRAAVEWQEPRCLLCNSSEGSMLVEAPDSLPGGSGLWFAVMQCQDCGLCYTCPRPSTMAMSQFYPKHRSPKNSTLRHAAERWWPFPDRSRHKHLERLPILGQGRLLDIGCGRGTFLQRMQQRGWSVTGLDASEKAVQRIRSELGLSALTGSLPHAELGEACFDLITMRHSLEHAHQPLEVLRAAYRLLAPDGQLIVSAPNIDSLPFKWFGRHWRGLNLPRHSTHFTPDTLQLMLARAGFDIGPVRMLRHAKWIRKSAQLSSSGPEALWWQRLFRRRLLANTATWYAYLAGRSDTMTITAVKRLRVHHDAVPAFSQYAPQRHGSGADRWRNT